MRDCNVESGSNYANVTIGKLSLAFSYKTVIGIKDYVKPWILRENVWGPTTGKHMNALDGGSKEKRALRLSSDEFEKLLADTLKKYGLGD